jgi:hypothetical protein
MGRGGPNKPTPFSQMDWETLKFHLQTALYICATSLGFGLFGFLLAGQLP